MITSPLRYPGGKAKLFPFFSELIAKNKLLDCTYYEPFAGGAGLAIRLLTSGFVSKICINDIDSAVYSFWISVLNDASAFCRLIERTPITIEEWHRQKKVFDRGDERKPLSLGFAAYFLNRTNRSGILDGAGPIGGYAQSGTWKVDARFVKERQIANIQSLSRFSKAIEVSNLDAADFIDKNLTRQHSLFYLDPPYFVKGQKLYKNFYQIEDHASIAAELTKKRFLPWVVSYDDAPEIRELYSDFSHNSYMLNYSAGEKCVGREIMFCSDTITLPDIDSNAKTAA